MGHAEVNFSMDSDDDVELSFVIQNCIDSLDDDGISDLPKGEHCSVCLDTFEDIKHSGKSQVGLSSISGLSQVYLRSISGLS